MFHSNTERMIAYWTSRAAGGRAPSRATIQPTDFRPLMPQVFILGRESRGDYRVRLSGASSATCTAATCAASTP